MSRSDSIRNLGQNFVNSLLEFRNVRTAPIGLPAVRTLVKVVVVYTRERFELFDYTFFGDGRQHTVAAQTPGKRGQLASKGKTPDYFHGLFNGTLRSRKVAGSDPPMHQERSVACEERTIFQDRRD